MSALGLLFRCLSPAGPKARLSILIFHRVVPVPDPLFPDLPDRRRFERMLDWVKGWFNVLPLDQAVRQLVAGTLPERAAAITFDDGYADNFVIALPLLRERGLTATFFVTTGFLDGGRMFNDTVIEAVRGCARPLLDLDALGLGRHPLGASSERRAAINKLIDGIKYRPAPERLALSERIAAIAGSAPPSALMMSTQQVQELHRAGMQIGAHSVSHPILAKLTLDDARHEISDGRKFLEDLLGERVGLFAYPNGKPGEDYTEDHAQLVRQLGFDAAVSTHAGAATVSSDLMQLPRFTPWDRGRFRFGARLAANLLSDGVNR